jgi:signal peptidase II
MSIILSILVVDALIKNWVHSSVVSPIAVWQNFLGIDFYIEHAVNTGAAWGILKSFQKPLLVARVFVVLMLVIIMFKNAPNLKKSFYLSLIVGGALGNVLDFFLYRHVIDMFHFVFSGRSFGIFNFADVMIFLGCLGYMITSRKTIHEDKDCSEEG